MAVKETVSAAIEDASLNAASARYLATSNPGEAIDRDLIMFAVGVMFGLLVKIAEGQYRPGGAG